MSGNSSAYPWAVDGQDLCPVLSDSELLGAVFESADSEFLCDAIEIAGFRPNPLIPTSLQRMMRPAATGRNLGKHIVRVLADPAKRKQLFGRMSKALHSSRAANSYLAQRLFAFVSDRYNGILPDTDLVCYHRDKKYYLDAAKFASWLSTCAFDDANRRPIALFVCAFAMLQPKDAPQFRQALLDADAGFHLLLLDEGEESNEPELARVLVPTATPQPDSSPASEVAPTQFESTMPACVEIAAANDEASLVNHEAMPSVSTVQPPLLDVRDGWFDSLPIGQLRVTQSHLQKALDGLNDGLNGLQELKNDLQSRLERISKLPLFVGQLEIPRWQPDVESCNLTEAKSRLGEILPDCHRIERSYQILETLAARIGKQPERLPNDGSVLELSVLADHSEAQVTLFETLVRELTQRETRVREALQALDSTEERHRPKRLMEMDALWYIDLAEMLVGTRLLESATSASESDVTRQAIVRLRDSRDFIGLLVAMQWRQDVTTAIQIADKVLIEAGDNVAKQIQALSFINHRQLALFVEQRPNWLAEAMELILATAVRTNDAAKLLWLQPLLYIGDKDSTCWSTYEQLFLAAERSEIPDLSALLHDDPPAATPTNFKATLSDLVERPTNASLGTTFRELRENARTTFLRELSGDIHAGRPDLALTKWRTFGDLDEIVEECISQLPPRRDVEPRHREKTVAYLKDFQDKLMDWERQSKGSNPSRNIGLRRVVATAVERGLRSTGAPRRLALILSGYPGDGNVQWPPEDFGSRCDDNGIVANAVALGLIKPTMFNSWISVAKSDEVQVVDLFADVLSNAFRNETRVVDADLIEEYLHCEEWDAARSAAGTNSQLTTLVEDWLSRRRNDLRSRNRLLLDEATQVRKINEYVDLDLNEFEEQLGACKFLEAELTLNDLEELLVEHRRASDPETTHLIRFLQEAGKTIGSGDTKETLCDRADALRAAAGNRRCHIEELRDRAQRLPETVQKHWLQAAESIDTPAQWPNDDDGALAFAGWIEFVGKYLETQSKDRDDHPSLIDRVVFALGHWFAGTLEECASQPNQQSFGEFTELERGIRHEFWGPRKVLDFVMSRPNAPPEELPIEPPASLQVKSSMRISGTTSESSTRLSTKSDEPMAALAATGITAGIRDYLQRFRALEPAVARTSEEALEKALKLHCGARAWATVRELVANHSKVCVPESGGLSEEECVYAMALAMTVKPGEEQFLQVMSYACLAAILEGLEVGRYYLRQDDLKDVVMFCLSTLRHERLTENPESDELRSEMRAVLNHIANSRRGDRLRSWFVELLRAAKAFVSSTSTRLRGDLLLARWLWDFPTRLRDVAAVRMDLLKFLFDQKNTETLIDLADQHAKPVRFHIAHCLEAFLQAEANPEALEDAHYRALIVVEQSKRVKTIRPWTMLISKLDTAPKDFEGEPPCRVEEELISWRQGHLLLQFSLIPARYDYPEEAVLRISAGQDDLPPILEQDLLCGEVLTSRRIVTVRIDTIQNEAGHGFARLPYHISGRSISQKEFELRGVWTGKPMPSAETALDTHSIERLWPGASGKAVKTRSDYHGREDELRRIDVALSGQSGRQGSLVVIGLRRIGKTSLLNQVLESNRPSKGHVCAAYCSLDSLNINIANYPSLAAAIFHSVVLRHLENYPGEPNDPIKQAVGAVGPGDLTKLFRGLATSDSLSSTLEGMVDILSLASGGVVSRLALCIDEFQSIFRWKNPDEINSLMWDLRAIVQNSTKISLVLAGSGMMRELISRPDAALFGSIEAIELSPFDIEKDRSAIADTLLPMDVRDSMAPTEEAKDALLRRAHDLAGGHPWNLALLGWAVGITFGRQPVTPAMLNHVSEEMIAGRVRSDLIYAEKFYGHLIQSLAFIDPRAKAIAEVCLVEIAKQTTTDYPWVAASHILNHEPLLDHTSFDERSYAVNALTQEGIIDSRSNRQRREYRIHIPLAAIALRHDADKVEDQAFSKLRVVR